jgi:hypothetical protein
MACSTCKKKNLRDEVIKTTKFVSTGIVIFTIIWFLLGGYGLYTLITKLL